MGLADKLREHIKALPKPAWKRRPEILLCPNVPKPMHGVAPRVILGDKWWNTTRQAAYRSTNYHCVACGVYKYDARSRQWLEGHELYQIDYARGRMLYLETVPLCHFCHAYIHDGRLQHLLERGEIHQAKYIAIIQHGDRVLRDAGLIKPSHFDRDYIIVNGVLAPWHRWRLILNGKQYPPKFKTPEAWKAAFDV